MKEFSRKGAKALRRASLQVGQLCAFAPWREIILFFGVGAVYSACVAEISSAAEPSAAVTYQDHLLPLLRENCFGCHNNDKTEGGLNMTSFASLMKGGGSGVVIEPGDLDGSYLYQLVTHKSEPHMPPNAAKLPDEKLAVIRKFIEGGSLETTGSKPIVRDKPKANLVVAADSTKAPEGPPPMPPRLPLQPFVATPRAGAITGLAASPWAPLVAIAGQQQILLYHTDRLELLGVLPFPEGTPHVLKFSRSGKLLLAGGGHDAKSGRVVVWDVTTGGRVIEVGDEFDSVLAADISPDQSLIALGGPSKVVRIYSTADGKLLHEIKKHTDWVTAIEFNPDNVLLATGDRNGGLFVWESANAQEYHSLRGHSAGITSLSWRHDGNVLASASDDSSVRLWEMEGGSQIKTWNAHGGVQSIEFCRDGKLITGGRDRNVQRWTPDGKPDGKPQQLGDVVLRAVVAFGGERMIAGDWAGTVRVWAVADGKPLADLSANPPALEQRLQTATEQFAAAEAGHRQCCDNMNAAQQSVAAMTAQIDEAQQAAQQAAAAETLHRGEAAKLQSAIDSIQADIDHVKQEIAQRQSALELLTQASAKAAEAAKKLPNGGGLNEAGVKLTEASQAISTEVTTLNKSADDKTTALTACRAQLSVAQAKLTAATTSTETAQEKLQTALAAKKTAEEKAAAEKLASEQSAAALAAAQSARDRWMDEIAFASGRAEKK